MKQYHINMFSDYRHARQLNLLNENLYNAVPEPFPGSIEAVEDFRSAGFYVAVFTHSGIDWGLKKTIDNGFRVHKIITLPTDLVKNSAQLQNAMENLGTNKDEVVYIGDSWKADIDTALDAGIHPDNVFRVRTKYPHANKGERDGIMQVNSFSEIPQLLVERWLRSLHSQ
jgi:phosphoglycolate phosphatase-like HAD superfamily hydrolase